MDFAGFLPPIGGVRTKTEHFRDLHMKSVIKRQQRSLCLTNTPMDSALIFTAETKRSNSSNTLVKPS